MDDVDYRRLQWSCRRGMLENDLVLQRFLAKHGSGLSGERLAAFRSLLEYADGDLWDLVSGRGDARDPALSDIVQLLRSC